MTQEQLNRLEYLRSLPPDSKTEEQKEETRSLYRQEKAFFRQEVGPEFYDWLTAMLFRHDPIGLAKMDCPKDEYEVETRHILKSMKTNNVPVEFEAVYEQVWQTFHKMFKPSSGTKELYRPIAVELYDKLKAS